MADVFIDRNNISNGPPLPVSVLTGITYPQITTQTEFETSKAAASATIGSLVLGQLSYSTRFEAFTITYDMIPKTPYSSLETSICLDSNVVYMFSAQWGAYHNNMQSRYKKPVHGPINGGGNNFTLQMWFRIKHGNLELCMWGSNPSSGYNFPHEGHFPFTVNLDFHIFKLQA